MHGQTKRDSMHSDIFWVPDWLWYKKGSEKTRPRFLILIIQSFVILLSLGVLGHAIYYGKALITFVCSLLILYRLLRIIFRIGAAIKYRNHKDEYAFSSQRLNIIGDLLEATLVFMNIPIIAYFVFLKLSSGNWDLRTYPLHITAAFLAILSVINSILEYCSEGRARERVNRGENNNPLSLSQLDMDDFEEIEYDEESNNNLSSNLHNGFPEDNYNHKEMADRTTEEDEEENQEEPKAVECISSLGKFEKLMIFENPSPEEEIQPQPENAQKYFQIEQKRYSSKLIGEQTLGLSDMRSFSQEESRLSLFFKKANDKSLSAISGDNSNIFSKITKINSNREGVVVSPKRFQPSFSGRIIDQTRDHLSSPLLAVEEEKGSSKRTSTTASDISNPNFLMITQPSSPWSSAFAVFKGIPDSFFLVILYYSFQYDLLFYPDELLSLLLTLVYLFFSLYTIVNSAPSILNGVPGHIDSKVLYQELLALEGVESIHNFHLWTPYPGKAALSAHMVAISPQLVLHQATVLCRLAGIYHTCLQVENSQIKASNLNFINCEHDL